MVAPQRRRRTPPPADGPPTRSTRVFRQARAHATRESLLRAARAIFEERGFDGAQTPEIAARAGASVGSFYRYFHDKRHAFLEVVESYLEETQRDAMREIARRVADAAEGRPAPYDSVRAVIDTLFDHVKEAPAIVRVYHAMSLRDPEVARMRAAVEARVRGDLARFFEPITSRRRIPDARAAAEVVYLSAAAIAVAQFVHRRDAKGAADEKAVRQALVDMICRHLFGTTGAKGGGGLTPATR